MKTVLALSSLVHPSRFISRSAQIKELVAFLSLIEVSSSTSKVKMNLIWRPHPEERELACEMAGRMEIDLDSSRSLKESINSADVIVCSLSGSIISALQLGKVPFVWAGQITENCGLWRQLPTEILFSTSDELLDRIEESDTSFSKIRDLVNSKIEPGKFSPLSTGFFISVAKELRASAGICFYSNQRRFFHSTFSDFQ